MCLGTEFGSLQVHCPKTTRSLIIINIISNYNMFYYSVLYSSQIGSRCLRLCIGLLNSLVLVIISDVQRSLLQFNT
jgi:hypothetical protein